jgi:hypothetical protein
VILLVVFLLLPLPPSSSLSSCTLGHLLCDQLDEVLCLSPRDSAFPSRHSTICATDDHVLAMLLLDLSKPDERNALLDREAGEQLGDAQAPVDVLFDGGGENSNVEDELVDGMVGLRSRVGI